MATTCLRWRWEFGLNFDPDNSLASGIASGPYGVQTSILSSSTRSSKASADAAIGSEKRYFVCVCFLSSLSLCAAVLDFDLWGP